MNPKYGTQDRLKRGEKHTTQGDDKAWGEKRQKLQK